MEVQLQTTPSVRIKKGDEEPVKSGNMLKKHSDKITKTATIVNRNLSVE